MRGGDIFNSSANSPLITSILLDLYRLSNLLVGYITQL
ncbi:hypothetical protein EU95_1473 [Prochlorococcus marinus str. MIT 9201]|uniref:Uncharacterized protein n=1 Tax=Prochlorococcus marinus str. MIT 9201 TaxID=93057 RepID=A0A0A2A0K3_PROMR|nr:hypothetical protein EU95_1473 [Prochlorococcus marinus str. MIT 9201]